MLVESTFALLFADFILDRGTLVSWTSRVDCGLQCVQTRGCASFFYSQKLKTCLLSLTTYKDTTGLTNGAGYKYYRMTQGFGRSCETTADCRYQHSRCRRAKCGCNVGFSYDSLNGSCVMRFGMTCKTVKDCAYRHSRCYQTVCECKIGFSFSSKIGRCVKRCTRYGDTFNPYIDHGISKCNIRALKTNTVARCKEVCLETSRFVCVNVEYNNINKDCQLCDKAWFDLPKKDLYYDTFDRPVDVHQRHCAK